MKHILSTEVINKILAYLSSKTYSEVINLIEEIKSNAQQYVEPTYPTEQEQETESIKTKKSKN